MPCKKLKATLISNVFVMTEGVKFDTFITACMLINSIRTYSMSLQVWTLIKGIQCGYQEQDSSVN